MTLRLDYGAVSSGAVGGMYGTNAYLGDAPIDQALRRLIELRVSQFTGATTVSGFTPGRRATLARR